MTEPHAVFGSSTSLFRQGGQHRPCHRCFRCRSCRHYLSLVTCKQSHRRQKTPTSWFHPDLSHRASCPTSPHTVSRHLLSPMLSQCSGMVSSAISRFRSDGWHIASSLLPAAAHEFPHILCRRPRPLPIRIYCLLSRMSTQPMSCSVRSVGLCRYDSGNGETWARVSLPALLLQAVLWNRAPEEL